MERENSVVKFADDTTVIEQISNDEISYQHCTELCTENNLLPEVSKTKELVVDSTKKRRQRRTPPSTSVELRRSR